MLMLSPLQAFIALFFLRCLQSSDYFSSHQSPSSAGLTDQELLVGAFMIHVMEVASMNSHEIGQVECEPGQSWLVGQTRPVGCALEPSLVLLNHSCDPTMIRVNTGSSTLCFASRDIKAGEEITDGYSFSYDITGGEERRRYLADKYQFSCSCPACEQAWPTYQHLPKSFNDLSPDQLNIDPLQPQIIQGRMKTIMQLGAKINQVRPLSCLSLKPPSLTLNISATKDRGLRGSPGGLR